MIYFMIVMSIIVADKILKEYFKSSFQGKHRKESLNENKTIRFKIFEKIRNKSETKEQTGERAKGTRNETIKESIKKQTKQTERKDIQKKIFAPEIELLENKGAASGILASHPKLLKGISAAMLCFCVLALGKERQKGKVTIAGIGYALILGGGLSNFIDRMKKGAVTDYIRFPDFPVKKISQLVFNLSDFGIFAGVFCLLFRKK